MPRTRGPEGSETTGEKKGDETKEIKENASSDVIETIDIEVSLKNFIDNILHPIEIYQKIEEGKKIEGTTQKQITNFKTNFNKNRGIYLGQLERGIEVLTKEINTNTDEKVKESLNKLLSLVIEKKEFVLGLGSLTEKNKKDMEASKATGLGAKNESYYQENIGNRNKTSNRKF